MVTDRDLQEWASRGLRELRLIPVHTAPERPRAGTIIYADGTDFDPGSGEGVYFYNAAGSWIFLG